MLSTKQGKLISIISGDFLNDKKETINFYKIGILDEDEIIDDRRIKFFKVKEKALKDFDIFTEEKQKLAVGTLVILMGKDLPRYLKKSSTWITEFVCDQIEEPVE